MNKLDKETAIALAKNNMNITDTAMSLGVHRNTVLFRIERMKDRTGLDAKNFYELHKLVSMATGEDMQEVLRCKDCKHCVHLSTKYKSDIGCAKLHTDSIYLDFWCRYGKRKDNEKD